MSRRELGLRGCERMSFVGVRDCRKGYEEKDEFKEYKEGEYGILSHMSKM